MRSKWRRLTDRERETIQLLSLLERLNIAQTARAMKCDRRTVRYWRETEKGEFVRPKGFFADDK